MKFNEKYDNKENIIKIIIQFSTQMLRLKRQASPYVMAQLYYIQKI